MNPRSIITSLSLAALLVGLAACGTVDAATPDTVASSDSVVPSTTVASTAADAAFSADDTGLTEDEIAGLVLMREEEKLARDVYLTLYDLWGTQVFQNIAASEQRHTTAVEGLLEQFGIPDPVADDTVGVFADPALAALHDDLIEQGSESLAAALGVGALIEDLDIADLRELLELTDDPDIERVYGNLLRGSENHLRAFTGRLKAEGETYTATYLTQDEIDEILADDASSGGSGSNDNRQRRGRRA